MKVGIMKIFILLMVFSGAVHAQVYKCDSNGKTSYQQNPCATGGGEIKMNHHFDRAEYNAAMNRHNAFYKKKAADDKAIYEANERIRKQNIDYYTLRARESSAIAQHQQVREIRRQTAVIQQQSQRN